MRNVGGKMQVAGADIATGVALPEVVDVVWLVVQSLVAKCSLEEQT